jgi:hypothetical protein
VNRLLCYIGLHHWHLLGWMRSLIVPGQVFECLCCHRREARYGYATVYCNAPREGWNDYIDNFNKEPSKT